MKTKTVLLTMLMAATAAPTIATAQTPAQHRAEIYQDKREIQQGRREVQRDIRHGNWQEAREDRREIREDRRELREDRRENREDWRHYRERNRHVYQRPAYEGPHGYRYQAWRQGARLPSAYYGPRYIIVNPGIYRLPRASHNLRWVRYGNDALLVNVRSGVIRDVIRNFFW